MQLQNVISCASFNRPFKVKIKGLYEQTREYTTPSLKYFSLKNFIALQFKKRKWQSRWRYAVLILYYQAFLVVSDTTLEISWGLVEANMTISKVRRFFTSLKLATKFSDTVCEVLLRNNVIWARYKQPIFLSKVITESYKYSCS